MHQVYLSLGSNIEPELNLPRAVELLQKYGEVRKTSQAWESQAVGSEGPNFLNACILFGTVLSQAEVKEKVIGSIETTLGRKRTTDKYAPRTIDIDIVLFDEQLCDDKYWKQAFVVVPLAEVHPGYQNPLTHENARAAAARFRQEVWIEARPGLLDQFKGYSVRS